TYRTGKICPSICPAWLHVHCLATAGGHLPRLAAFFCSMRRTQSSAISGPMVQRIHMNVFACVASGRGFRAEELFLHFKSLSLRGRISTTGEQSNKTPPRRRQHQFKKSSLYALKKRLPQANITRFDSNEGKLHTQMMCRHTEQRSMNRALTIQCSRRTNRTEVVIIVHVHQSV
ncbi:unnamed protein product, partial [Ectocarpus sp. 13 AM-2016]